MKTTLLSGTTDVLAQILTQLGAVDFQTSPEDAPLGDRFIKLSNSRLTITIVLDHARVEFDSLKFNRASHKGFYDIYDVEQVATLILWVKTVMEA